MSYMMITCQNGIFRGYWYQDGYIRTASHEFCVDDVSDPLVHLTNDAIQKYSEDYGKYEQGNKLTFYEFQKYLELWYSDQKYNIFNQILPKLKEIARDSVRASFLKIDPLKRENSFEIFGLDFMIDDNFKPVLIEINTNPDITTHNPVCSRVIPTMLENAFRIGLDPLFPPPINWPAQKKHYAPDNMLENNKFELIFDEIQDGQNLKELYDVDFIGDIDEEEEMKSDEEPVIISQSKVNESFD